MAKRPGSPSEIRRPPAAGLRGGGLHTTTAHHMGQPQIAQPLRLRTRPDSTIAAAASRLRLFSLRELAVHPRRTIASIAVMAVSAMYLVAIFGIFGSITGSVNRLADGVAGIAALEVSGITDSGFPDSIAADVAAVPGVAVAAPMIRMSAPTATGPVLLFGADKRSAELGGAFTDALSQPLGELADTPDGVQVGPGLGQAKGARFQLGSGTVTVTYVLQGRQRADRTADNTSLPHLRWRRTSPGARVNSTPY